MFSTPVRMFCFLRLALSHTYSRDVTPGKYGAPGGKNGIVLPVSSRSGPLTLKHMRATCGGEIKNSVLFMGHNSIKQEK